MSASGAGHLGASLVSAHTHAAESKKSDEDDTSNNGGNKGASVSLALILGVVKKGSSKLGSGLVVKSGSSSLIGSRLVFSGLSGISSLLLFNLGDGNVDDLEILAVLLRAVDTSDVGLTSGDWDLTDKIVANKFAESGVNFLRFSTCKSCI